MCLQGRECQALVLPKDVCSGPSRVLGREAGPLSLGSPCPCTSRASCEDPFLSPATDHTVNLLALCHTLSPQEPLGPSRSQLLPLPCPPSVNIQDLSGQLDQAPSDNVASRHQRDGPFTQVGGPAGRPPSGPGPGPILGPMFSPRPQTPHPSPP